MCIAVKNGTPSSTGFGVSWVPSVILSAISPNFFDFHSPSKPGNLKGGTLTNSYPQGLKNLNCFPLRLI